MKPLDEHLRDASSAWLDEARPTLRETEERISAQMSGGRTASGYILGGTAILIVGAVIGWLTISSLDPVNTQRTASEPIAISHPATPSIRPVSPPSETNPPSTATSVVPPSRQVQEEEGSGRTDRWIADGTQDGFSAEYERVLARAMQFERTDPLRAANEYLGLGRLCNARQQYAHAVSALQRAEELVRRGQFTHLSDDVRRHLDEAQRSLGE